MMKRVLIPLTGDDIAPRFDQALEALIVEIDDQHRIGQERTIILSRASSEALCNLILTQGITTVVCCGIEDEHFQYLTWKGMEIFDSVAGPYSAAVDRLADGALRSGDILLERRVGG
jgi:predicted Fe-Mo cluster-binding NifX family protein